MEHKQRNDTLTGYSDSEENKTQVRICGEYDWTGGGGSPHLIIILGALESGHVPPCITAGKLIYLISS